MENISESIGNNIGECMWGYPHSKVAGTLWQSISMFTHDSVWYGIWDDIQIVDANLRMGIKHSITLAIISNQI